MISADTVKKAGRFSSDPNDHLKYIQQHIDLGFTHIYFHSAGPDQRAFLESYGRDILPKVRAHHAFAAH